MDDATRASGIAQQSTGRLGTPNDVGNLVRFLLSEQGQGSTDSSCTAPAATQKVTCRTDAVSPQAPGARYERAQLVITTSSGLPNETLSCCQSCFRSLAASAARFVVPANSDTIQSAQTEG
jgi:hypothetical protein